MTGIDTDTMQAELEAAGYEIYLSQNPLRKNSWVCFDGWYFEISDIGLIIEDNHDEDTILHELVTKAYTHLQQQRELEALRAFVLDIVRYPLVMEETISSCVPAIPLQVYGEAKALINQYNIKDDDDE